MKSSSRIVIAAAYSVFAFHAAFADLKEISVLNAPFPFSVNEWTPPMRDFPITDHGAKRSGAPVTEAIERAIKAAHDAGGGRVVVPPGEWLSGAIKLKSDVALVVQEGATLRFPDDPVVAYRAPLKSNGRPNRTCAALIQADGCTNVAVMGSGTIAADVDYWHRNFMIDPEKGFPRPQFFMFRNCRNVRAEGFKVRGSPAWTLVFELTDDIVLRNVDCVGTGPNTDGLDLVSCNRALVEGCSLDQTDDAFTIKSGFNEAGRRRNRPTQNVVIRNCRAVHGHSLLGIGSEVSGGIRNIYMTDCTVDDHCTRWLYVKTNPKRGAVVDGVTMENVRGRRASQGVMEVEMFYDGNPNKELTSNDYTPFVTAISNITVRHIVCEEAGWAVKVRGDARQPPVGLVAEDFRVGRVLNRNGNLVSATNAPDLRTHNVRLDSSVAGATKAVTFPLEWNATYDTSIPFEIEVEPMKISPLLGGSNCEFTVVAKTKKGDVGKVPKVLRGRTEKSLRLRFAAPAGTAALSCTARPAANPPPFVTDYDNMFGHALEGVGGWRFSKLCKAEKTLGGLEFSAKGWGSPEARYVVDVPPGLAGKPVVFESEAENVGQEATMRTMRITQLDAEGNELPESVVDRRWTSHKCPPGFKIRYLEEGRLRPDAAKVCLLMKIDSPLVRYDSHGLPQAEDRARLARHVVRRLSLRPAVTLPFPRYSDAFFRSGVSGRPGDASLALGGGRGAAFWYQTRSSASWSDKRQVRDENEVFFPSGAGTVEAWFSSDWKPVYADGGGARKCREYSLFEAHHSFRASERRNGCGTAIALMYRPDPGSMTAFFREPTTKKEWSASADVKLPRGKWCHIALQWTPKGDAEAFVDGRRVLSMPIPGWLGCDLADKSITIPNDENAQEFFIGGSCDAARIAIEAKAGPPLVDGAVDLFRASTGRRYADGFNPPRSLKCDGRTRAIFTFDRTFDGVSGGGLGWLPGTVRALDDRVEHSLALADGRSVDYWPKEILPDNDPRKVFDIVNYPVLPSPADFEAMSRPFSRTATLKPGEKLEFDAPDGSVTDFTEIANVSDKPLTMPVLINDGELDPRSFGDIADTMGLAGLSPRERVNRVFQLVLSAEDYFLIHSAVFPRGSDMPRDTEYDCLAMLNGYCGFECGPMNFLTANLFVNVARCPAVQTGGYAHSFEQVFFDGKNHIYDLSAQKFFPAWDNETSAYLKEGGDQPGIFNRMTMSCDHFIRRGDRGFGGMASPGTPRIGFTLRPGESFRAYSVNDGNCNDLITDRKTGVYKGGTSKWKRDMSVETHADTAGRFLQRVERFFPHYMNGFITFSGRPAASNPAFTRIAADSFCYSVDSGGYPIVAARYRAVKTDGSDAALEVSTDGGATFRPLVSPANYAVRARLAYLVRIGAQMDDVAELRASTEVQMNSRVFPGKVRPGANGFMLKALSGGEARVTVAGRSAAKRVKVAAGRAAYSGTVKGAEKLFTAFDSSAVSKLALDGLSPSATVRSMGNVAAELSGGMLSLQARDPASTAFGAAVVSDGGAEKEIVALCGPGVRFATAEDAAATGPKASVAGPDATSPQARCVFSGVCAEGSYAEFRIGPTPAGRYAVFNLNRFVSHPEQKAGDGLRMVWKGQKRNSYGCGSPRNNSCNFLKANYGRPGGKANWKWDFPYREKSWGIYQSLMTVNVPAGDAIRFFSWRPDPVEVAAVLVVPEPSEELRAEMIKIFCGLNSNPWRIACAGRL